MFVEPQRHEDTKNSQSRPPTHPVETADHADERRWDHATLLCAARSWPPDEDFYRSMSCGEAPWPSNGHGVAGPGNRLKSELSCRLPGPATCALEERKPRHLSSSFNRWEGCTSPTTRKRKERQNRRAQGTSAVEKTDSDGCLRPESSVFSTATGDYRSPVVLPARNGNAFQPQRTPLRVFVSSCLRRGRVGGSVPSVPLWFIRCTLASLA